MPTCIFEIRILASPEILKGNSALEICNTMNKIDYIVRNIKQLACYCMEINNTALYIQLTMVF